MMGSLRSILQHFSRTGQVRSLGLLHFSHRPSPKHHFLLEKFGSRRARIDRRDCGRAGKILGRPSSRSDVDRLFLKFLRCQIAPIAGWGGFFFGPEQEPPPPPFLFGAKQEPPPPPPFFFEAKQEPPPPLLV